MGPCQSLLANSSVSFQHRTEDIQLAGHGEKDDIPDTQTNVDGVKTPQTQSTAPSTVTFDESGAVYPSSWKPDTIPEEGSDLDDESWQHHTETVLAPRTNLEFSMTRPRKKSKGKRKKASSGASPGSLSIHSPSVPRGKQSLHPDALAHFQKLKLQADLASRQQRQQELQERLAMKREDIHQNKTLWDQFKLIQKQQELSSTPGAEENSTVQKSREQTAVAHAPNMSDTCGLQNTESWYVFVQDSARGCTTDCQVHEADSISELDEVSQAGLSLLSGTSLEAQRRLYSAKKTNLRRPMPKGGSSKLPRAPSSQAKTIRINHYPMHLDYGPGEKLLSPLNPGENGDVSGFEVTFSRQSGQDDMSCVSELDDISMAGGRGGALRGNDYGPTRRHRRNTSESPCCRVTKDSRGSIDPKFAYVLQSFEPNMDPLSVRLHRIEEALGRSIPEESVEPNQETSQFRCIEPAHLEVMTESPPRKARPDDYASSEKVFMIVSPSSAQSSTPPKSNVSKPFPGSPESAVSEDGTQQDALLACLSSTPLSSVSPDDIPDQHGPSASSTIKQYQLVDMFPTHHSQCSSPASGHIPRVADDDGNDDSEEEPNGTAMNYLLQTGLLVGAPPQTRAVRVSSGSPGFKQAFLAPGDSRGSPIVHKHTQTSLLLAETVEAKVNDVLTNYRDHGSGRVAIVSP